MRTVQVTAVGPARRRRLATALAAVCLGAPALLVACSAGGSDPDPSASPALLYPSATSSTITEARTLPEQRSVSIGLDDMVRPDQDWTQVSTHLDDAGVNSVHLTAGRVEFTAFDWSAHPEAAAEPGTDHVARAIDATQTMPDGSERIVDLMIDTFVPEWIEEDPSIAGVMADGTRTTYVPSATAVLDGPVGDRYVELAVELARRYAPNQITFSELAFDGDTFGDDDLALFTRMTGADDWPRDADGDIQESAPAIGQWRSEVTAQFLRRVRAELDKVEPHIGQEVLLGQDVFINWDDPGAGRPDVGHDYDLLSTVVDRLVVWAYLGLNDHTPQDVARFAAAAQESALPTSTYVISIGLWAGEEDADHTEHQTIAPSTLRDAVRMAQSRDVKAVNVTPYSLMSLEHWDRLGEVWAPAPSPSTTP